MSKKSNPTLIGAFVVGATALFAIAVAVFGGAQLFAKREVYISYFAERTQGLRVGSNVTMNGAQIGYVTDMVLLVNRDTFQSTTAVTFEILPESWIVIENGIELGRGVDSSIPHDELVNVGGLRAQLQSESLVTGQLLVDMTFQPDSEAVMRGGRTPPYPEIPTIPSNVQRILANLQNWMTDLTKNVDAEAASLQVQSIMQGLDELANSEDLRQSLAGANSIINGDETQQLSLSLQETMTEFRNAASDARSLLRNADSSLNTDLKPVIKRMAVTLDEARRALAAATVQLRGESIQSYQLGGALMEVEAAAKAMREFLDYLERNPEAVLRGKQQ